MTNHTEKLPSHPQRLFNLGLDGALIISILGITDFFEINYSTIDISFKRHILKGIEKLILTFIPLLEFIAWLSFALFCLSRVLYIFLSVKQKRNIRYKLNTLVFNVRNYCKPKNTLEKNTILIFLIFFNFSITLEFIGDVYLEGKLKAQRLYEVFNDDKKNQMFTIRPLKF